MLNSSLKQFNDIYFISERIKHINPFYKLYYNKALGRYEVHDTSNHYNSFCICFKNYPDKRVLDTLVSTRKENMKKLFEEIERNNAKLLKEENDRILDTANQKLSYALHTANSLPNQELTLKQIQKII